MLLSVLSSIFWGLLLLSVLVFIHEGGHYLAARLLNVRVKEFFLGMPCPVRLAHRSKDHGTLVGVTPVLLGGYTMICGMEGKYDDRLADILACVTRHGRVRVETIAQEVGKVEGAYDMLVTLADWASIEPYYDPELGETPNQENWPRVFQTPARDAQMLTIYDKGHGLFAEGASEAGTPRELPGTAEEFLAQERSHTYLGCNFLQRLLMLAMGPIFNIVTSMLLVIVVYTGMGTLVAINVPVVGSVTPDSLAEQVGIMPGDELTSINGVTFDTWEGMGDAIDAGLAAGGEMHVEFERDGEPHEVTVLLEEGVEYQYLGVSPTVERLHLPVLESARFAFEYAWQVATYVVRLIIPQHTMEVLNNSTSVVGISNMAAEAANTSIESFLMLASSVSMSLGFMNLLPIPPLDGGKILLEVIELIRKKPLSVRAQNIISYVGLAFFLFIFVYVLRMDIFRIIAG